MADKFGPEPRLFSALGFFLPEARVGPLPRSGYTEHPRALALGFRWLVRGALKVVPDVGVRWWNNTQTRLETRLGRHFSSFVPHSRKLRRTGRVDSRYT
jgi:hypothetical protein